MGAKVNEQIRSVFWLGATGQTVVYTIIKPDNTVEATGNMTENPNKANEYYQDWTPDEVGVWRFIGVCPLQVFEGELIYHVGMGQEKDVEDGIAALNDVSAAEVEAECIDALESFILDGLIAVASPGGVPVADSYLDYIMNKDAGQTYARATDSLEILGENSADILTDIAALQTAAEGGTAAVNRAAGKKQVFVTTVDLHQAAGTYDIATATTQGVIVESIIFSSQLDLTDEAGAFTGVTVQTDTTTEQEFIDANLGQKANLGAEAQVYWEGPVLVRVTDKVQFTIEGGTADVDPTTCDVIITFRAIANGGYLV